jgi:hypothetical protein
MFFFAVTHATEVPFKVSFSQENTGTEGALKMFDQRGVFLVLGHMIISFCI